MASQEQPNERLSEEYILLKERAKTLGLKVSPNIGLAALRLKVNGALTGGGSEPDEPEPEDDEAEDEPEFELPPEEGIAAPDTDDDDIEETSSPDDEYAEAADSALDEDPSLGELVQQVEEAALDFELEEAPVREPSKRELREERERDRKVASQARRRGMTKHEFTEALRMRALKLVRVRIYNLNPSKRDLRGEIITIGNKYIGTVRKMIPFGEATENGYHIPQIIFDDLKARRFQAIMTKRVNGQIQVSSRMVPEYNLEVLPPLTPRELKELGNRQAAAERLAGNS